MDDRTATAWLARRVGFGLAPGELDQLAAAGLSTTLDRGSIPTAHGVAPAPDPWAGLDLSMACDPRARCRSTSSGRVIDGWLQAMATTPRPFEEWMRWFWHGHFVSTLRVVRRTGR